MSIFLFCEWLSKNVRVDWFYKIIIQCSLVFTCLFFNQIRVFGNSSTKSQNFLQRKLIFYCKGFERNLRIFLGRKNNFFLYLSSCLRHSSSSNNKRQINRRKTSRSLVACIPLVYMKDNQENWVTSWNGLSHPLKYPHLKTKDVGEPIIGCYQDKHRKKGNAMQI